MKIALLLVDLQNDYLADPNLEPAAGQIVNRAALLLQGCRKLGIPVLHAWTAVSRDDDRRMPHWKQAERWSCERGTPGHSTPEALRKTDDECIIEKCFFSAFSNSSLERTLREHGCDALILAGVHLHACVRQTALDAYQRGFEVCVAEDATGSNDPIHAAITRRYLTGRGTCFADVDSILRHLPQGTLPAAEPGQFQHVTATARNARSALPHWCETPLSQRAGMLERLATDLEQHAPVLAGDMAREIGKPVRYGRTEVLRTAGMLRAVIRRFSEASRDEAAGGVSVRRAPHGVVALITSWNNPAYIPLGKIAPAILSGNTVVWKPAPAAEGTSRFLAEALRSAGVPEGVVCLVKGGADVAQLVMSSPDVSAVSLTGSSFAGFSAQEICARRHIPLQAELGGNNGSIVWPDCDLAAAANQIAEGAFAMAGQRCTANRRVIVHASCAGAFLDRLVGAVAALKWGDPLDGETHVGPLVSAEHAARVVALIVRATPHASRIIVPHGGGAVTPAAGFDGAWHPPTILCCDDAGCEIVQEESFGPVLVVQQAESWDQAMALCNGVRQGLVAAIFTGSRSTAERFLAEAQAGILKVNRSTADAAVDVPFGGWKASGIGPPEHGCFDIDFYTRPQTAYIDSTLPPEPCRGDL